MKKLLILLIMLACVGSASAAEISAYEWDGVTGYTRINGALCSGNIFEVTSDITVTKLGSYNYWYGNVTPTDADYPVELYEVDSLVDLGWASWGQQAHSMTGTLLASVGIGTGADVEEDIGAAQYVTLATPVVLTAGKTYILNMDDTLARTYHAISDYLDITASGVTIASQITQVADYFSYEFAGDLGAPGEIYVGHDSDPPPLGGSPYWVGGPDMIFEGEPPIPVGGIDPDNLIITEDPGGTPSGTYVITLTAKLVSDAEVAVYLDPCDLWDGGLKQANVSPAYSGSNDANTALDITFTAANWDTPATVTLTAVNDTEGEPRVRYLTLNHSLVLVSGDFDLEGGDDPNWANLLLSPAVVDVNVVDNDQRYAVTVDELDGLSVSEQGPTSDDFTVVIEKSPTITLTVDITTDGETSLSSNALVFNSGNWNVPQTVTVTAIDDTVGETDPLTSNITYLVDSGLSWSPLASDNFNNTLEDGWTTYINEPGADANAVHDGAQLLTYGSTMAIAPGDFTADYRLTVECDFRGYAYNTIYLRNDGISHNYENGDVIRCGYWTGEGGALILNIAGNDDGQYGVPMPGWGTDPNVYRFIIEDFGDTVTVRMENVANPSNYLKTSGTGSYAALGAGTKIALGLIEDDGSDQGLYCAYDNFVVESLAGGQDEKIAWSNAPIEYTGDHDGDAEVDDNDCTAARATLIGDVNDDCVVDLADVAAIGENWLKCTLPNVPECSI